MTATTGGVYDAGLDRVYALAGGWCDGILYQFHLCPGCGRWECIVSKGEQDWFLRFTDSCRCDEHWLWFDVLCDRAEGVL